MAEDRREDRGATLRDVAERKTIDILTGAILNAAYDHAVTMHESINAGRGATGWRDGELRRRLENILHDLIDGARDAAVLSRAEGEQAGRDAEREACAKLIETVVGGTVPDTSGCNCGVEGAAAIRARGSK